MAQPPAENPYRSIPPASQVPQYHMDPAAQNGDGTGGIIPYKNPHALIAYYLGYPALFPIIGIPFGIASMILGFIGLSKRKKNPIIKGSAHAWFGIVCGFTSLLCPFLMFGAAVFLGNL